MIEEKRIPEVRFKGFDDTWEQRKLGEVVDIRSGRDYKHLSEGDIPVYGTGGYMLSVNEALSYKEDAIGIGRKGTIDKPYILRAPFWTVDTLFYAVPETNNDLDFIFNIFQNINWKQKDESTGVPSLSKTAINDIDVLVPDYKEQKTIGNFFSNLDNLITLHQRKLENTKNYKKAMLQKMFPQKGEKYPRLRFTGFTDAWEQRKWIDTVEISTNMVDPRKGIYDNLPHIGPGNIGTFTGRLLDNVNTVKEDNLISGKFHFKKGDVIYGKINPQLGKYVYAPYEGLASADAYVLNSKNGLHQTFLFIVLQTQHFFKYSVSVSMRSGIPKINRNELNEYSFMAPSEEEQEQIGKLFLDLDNLIILHQRKLDNLKNLKKALLQRMFI